MPVGAFAAQRQDALAIEAWPNSASQPPISVTADVGIEAVLAQRAAESLQPLGAGGDASDEPM